MRTRTVSTRNTLACLRCPLSSVIGTINIFALYSILTSKSFRPASQVRSVPLIPCSITSHTSPVERAHLSQDHQPTPPSGLRGSPGILCNMCADLQNRACSVNRHVQLSPVSTAVRVTVICKQNLQGSWLKRLILGLTPHTRKLD